MSPWQAMLWLAWWSIVGSGIGFLFARWQQASRPFNARYVRPRCLRVGHRWERLPGVPIQFCRRHKCMGARVAPFMFTEHYPVELIEGLEQTLDREAALSMDRRL